MLVDYNSISPWWQRVRDACSQSEQNCAAYVTGLVCRKVAADFVASQTEAKVWMLGWSFVLYLYEGECVCVCMCCWGGGVSVAPLMELALAVGLRITNFGGVFLYIFLTEQV